MSVDVNGWFPPVIVHQLAVASRSWNVALDKTPTQKVNGSGYSRTTANTTRMWWQYRCHVSFAWWKTPWNREPSSRRATYLYYVANGCQ